LKTRESLGGNPGFWKKNWRWSYYSFLHSIPSEDVMLSLSICPALLEGEHKLVFEKIYLFFPTKKKK